MHSPNWSDKVLKALLKDSAIYAFPSFVSRGLTLILVPLYTRILSPSDFGALDMFLTFGVLMNMIVALEVSQGVARLYIDEKDAQRRRAYVSSAFWFTLMAYSLFFLLCLFCAPTIATWVVGRDDLQSEFIACVAYIVVNGMFYLLQNQFRWEMRSRRYAEASLVVSFGTAAAVVLLAYAFKGGLLGFLIGMLIGSTLGLAYGLWWLRRSIAFAVDIRRLKEMLLYSLPLVPSGAAVWLGGYTDRLMINHYLSLTDVGLYGVGMRLSSLVGLLVAGVQGALMPLIIAHYREPQTPAQLARVFRLFVCAGLAFFVGLSLMAQDLLAVMTTPDFYASAQLVIYLVPAAMLAQMYIFAPGISIAKKTHLYLWLNLAGALVNAALSWKLISVLGLEGAAIATLVGSACVFALSMVISQRLYFVPHRWGRLISAVVLAVMLVGGLSQLTLLGVHSVWVTFASMGLLIAILMFTGLIEPNETKHAWAWVRARLFKTSGAIGK